MTTEVVRIEIDGEVAREIRGMDDEKLDKEIMFAVQALETDWRRSCEWLGLLLLERAGTIDLSAG